MPFRRDSAANRSQARATTGPSAHRRNCHSWDPSRMAAARSCQSARQASARTRSSATCCAIGVPRPASMAAAEFDGGDGLRHVGRRGQPAPASTAAIGTARRTALDAKLFGARQRLGLHLVDLMHKARYARRASPPAPRRAACGRRSADSRRRHAERSEAARSRERRSIARASGGRRPRRAPIRSPQSLRSAMRAQRLIARTRAQLLDVVRVGAHPISRRQGLPARVQRSWWSARTAGRAVRQGPCSILRCTVRCGGTSRPSRNQTRWSLRDEHETGNTVRVRRLPEPRVAHNHRDAASQSNHGQE